MGAMSELTVGDVGRGLQRYRPVAVTIGAILLAIAVLPKADVAKQDLIDTGRLSSVPAGAAVATADATTSPLAATPDVTFSGDASSSSPSFSSAPSFDRPSSSSSSPSFAPPPSPSPAPSDSGFASSPTTTIAATPFVPAPTTGSAQPLRIVAKAWASRTAGTPLASDGVPKGTLPVGARAGQDDKLSFIRLSGDETVLRLSEDSTGRATVQGPAAVKACRITVADWKEGEAIAIAAAPPSDPKACVEGAKSPEGVWLFDLSSFADRTDGRGFALLPGKGAGLDFQVAFKVS